MGASNAGGVGKNRDSAPISGFTAYCNAAIGQVLSTQRCLTTVPQVVALIAGSKRRSLLMAGDDGEMFMTKSQRYAKDNRTAHLTALGDKSVTNITNNKRLCSTFCTIEANY